MVTEIIQSKDNALFKKIRTLSSPECWLEGDHLCRAAFDKGVAVKFLVCTESFFRVIQSDFAHWLRAAKRVSVVHDALFKRLSDLPSAASVGIVIERNAATAIDPDQDTLVLDRVQDAGNVGSMLRSAAALGFKQVIALEGTAGLWSPKVLRAGMGAHFNLRLIEVAETDALSSAHVAQALRVPLICTSSHEGVGLHELQHANQIPSPCAWVFGHEGKGVSDALFSLCALKVRIDQPSGEESLNVAAAAAICLYASSAQKRA